MLVVGSIEGDELEIIEDSEVLDTPGFVKEILAVEVKVTPVGLKEDELSWRLEDMVWADVAVAEVDGFDSGGGVGKGPMARESVVV